MHRAARPRPTSRKDNMFCAKLTTDLYQWAGAPFCSVDPKKARRSAILAQSIDGVLKRPIGGAFALDVFDKLLRRQPMLFLACSGKRAWQ